MDEDCASPECEGVVEGVPIEAEGVPPEAEGVPPEAEGVVEGVLTRDSPEVVHGV